MNSDLQIIAGGRETGADRPARNRGMTFDLSWLRDVRVTRPDVDAAVATARTAQPSWAKLGGHGRARALYALARLVQKHSCLFAVLETLDNGKPIRETRDIDNPLVARHFYYHAGWIRLFEREFAGQEPLGVVAETVSRNASAPRLWPVARGRPSNWESPSNSRTSKISCGSVTNFSIRGKITEELSCTAICS